MKNLWPFVRRWAPLLSVLGLTITTMLREAGNLTAAGTGDFVAKLLELTITDPEMAASVTGFAGALYATVKKGAGVVAALRKKGASA